MSHHLILVLVLCQELRYLFHYHLHAQNELISALKIMTFFTMLPSINENCERESNPMP